MGTITTTTNSTPFVYPAQTLFDRDPTTGYLYCWVKVTTANTYELWQSVNGGTSWATYASFTRSNVQELGSIFITNEGWLYACYRTNESSQDRIYYREINVGGGSTTWNAEVLLGAPGNGGVAGAIHTGMDIHAVVTPASGKFVAIAIGTNLSGVLGVTLYGVRIAPSTAAAYDNTIFTTCRQWLPDTGTGRVGPSLDIAHNGDGKTSGTPHLWCAFGRTKANLVKLSWNGSGWTGPSTSVQISSSIGTRDWIPARWDGSRFLIANPSASTVVVYERNSANSATTIRTTGTHTTGVVRSCAVTWNHATGDIRALAVGTSTGVLYFSDFIRATSTWGAWTQVLANAVLGANVDNFGSRRGSAGSGKYDVYSAYSAVNTLAHTQLSVNYTPGAPTWSAPDNGLAQDVNATLTLDWNFVDSDPSDTQASYALSRQIGAGAVQYYTAAGGTWGGTEVFNATATTSVALASGWGAGSDANHVYKVKTRDAAGLDSVYSAAMTIIASVKVNPAITSPAVAAVLTSSSVPVTWTASEQTAYQLTLTAADVLDSFTRTATDTWSSADTGEAYTLSGTAADFDVAGGFGTIAPGAINSDRMAVVTADAGADRTVQVDAKYPALPASGSLRAGVMARYIDASNYYLGEISVASTGVVSVRAVKRVATVQTVMATVASPTAYVGGTLWRIRCDVAGSRIRVKAWPTTGSEPDWQIDTTDTAITTGVLAGCHARDESAAITHVASFDTFSSTSLAASYDSGWVTSTALTATPTTVLPDNSAWNIGLRTKNLEGLASEWQYSGVTVDFIEPATPTLVCSPNAAAGWIAVAITNPTPGGGQPAVAYQDLYRRKVGDTGTGVRVGAGLSSGVTVQDWRFFASAVIGTAYEYRSQVFGANGTSVYSAWTA